MKPSVKPSITEADRWFDNLPPGTVERLSGVRRHGYQGGDNGTDFRSESVRWWRSLSENERIRIFSENFKH